MLPSSGPSVQPRGLAVALLLAMGAAHADFEAGLAAFRAGDYAAALAEWRPLAESGSAPAQFNLGLMHEQGKGVPVDLDEAFRWYLASAEGGFARAQFRVGELYEEGRGVERDPVQALKWFTLARSARHPDAKKRRKQLAKTMTSTEIAYAEMYVREWKRARREGD